MRDGIVRVTMMVAATLLLAPCSSDSGGRDSGGGADASGISCGNISCGQGQICCIDCDGKGSCGPPGTACPGLACPPPADGGQGDAGGVACGDTTCAPGQVCCIDCDGKGSCGPPGTACLGVACPPLVDSGTGGPCGGKDQPCCSTGSPCGADLTCCTGVPYPDEGLCAEICDRKSDRNLKERITFVSPERTLDRLAALPVTRWSYRGDAAKAPHLGPMAQDFGAAFGVGATETRINLGDANGVVMLAVQGLHRRLTALSQRVSTLQSENRALKRELARLRSCTRRPGHSE